MNYELSGTLYPILSIMLNKGESITSQSHAVLSTSKDVEMTTDLLGGVTKAVRRLAGGESMFLSTLTAHDDNQVVRLADYVCGNMLALQIDPDHAYLCDKGAYLCSEPGVTLDVAFMRKIRMGLFGGEGFVMERLSGTGLAFLHGYGEIQKMTVAEGEEIHITSGRILAISTTVSMDVTFVRKLGNILFSGRGLFVTKLRGHGDVYVQSFSEWDVNRQNLSRI